MNNSVQAQKGFRTFILTLSVSLIVFSVIYYFVSSVDNTPDIRSPVSEELSVGASNDPVGGEAPLAFASLVAGTDDSAAVPVVLSGATENLDEESYYEDPSYSDYVQEGTESTVPDGGVLSVTVGLISSIVLFLAGSWVIQRGPRNFALNRFEHQFIEEN
jgi:hypothetical protein